MGGVALGTSVGMPLTVVVSSIRLPSRRRSNTKSISWAPAGTVVTRVGSASSVQTRKRWPEATQNVWSRIGDPCGSPEPEQPAPSKPAAKSSAALRGMGPFLS